MAHLHKYEDSTKEGVHWKCSQCGWESVHMYFGEVFEPEHLCPNEYCGCGHRRLDHRNGTCALLGLPTPIAKPNLSEQGRASTLS
jgi:ribosomal protein L37E